jgi:hypothetical protein
VDGRAQDRHGAGDPFDRVPVQSAVVEINADASASPAVDGGLRLALLRAPGRVFRFLAADAAKQLREAGNAVMELVASPVLVDSVEIGHPPRTGPLDLVMQVGPRVPAAVRLAAQSGAPLLRLDTPWPMAVAEAVRGALAEKADERPLLEIEVDGFRTLTLGPVHLVEGSSPPPHGEQDPAFAVVDGLRIEAAHSTGELELWRGGHQQSTVGCVEIGGNERVRLLIDGREHVGVRALVRPSPVMLFLLASERWP